MAGESGIYAEDIVKNSQGVVGLVLEDAEETTDESESDEEVLKKGQIVVCWYPSGNEETLSLSKVKLADRSLLPGDVVKFSNMHEGTQKGFVSNVEVVASVKVLVANQIFHNVDCKGLSPLQDFIPGVHVSMGPWLGIVTEVYRKVVLRIKNGSRCSLEGEQSSMLYDLSDQRDEDSPFYSASFYPGQKVAGPARAFKEARWLSGVKPLIHNQAQIKGTVEEASVIACDVDWQVCGACQHCVDEDESLKPPDATVTQDQLHRLLVVNHFRHANLQIGDKAFYTLKASDLRHAASGESECIQQTSDNDNTEGLDEHAYTSPPSDSQTEGCSVHEGETSSEGGNVTLTNGAKHGLGELLASKGDEIIAASVSLKSEGSSGSLSAENDSKNGNDSSSTTSLCHTHHSALTETSSNKTDSTCGVNEAGSVNAGTSQADVHDDQHHTAGSDSAEADEDSDGVEVVIPKVRGASVASALKHDSGASHPVRYPTKRRKKRLRRKRKAAPPLKVNVGDKVCVEVAHTCTRVDVIWQDGSSQEKILSTDLIPVFHLDELEFFPGDYVSDKRENANSSNYGVVLTADHKSRLCHIKWFSREGQELCMERDVSVYDITEHADFVFSAGDVVVRVAKNDSENEAAEQGAERPTPCVGQVTLVDEEGCVFIKWVDRTVSKVKPQELYKVDTEDDGHLSSEGSTVASDDEWETASGESTEEEPPVDIIGHVPRSGSTASDEGTENVDREALQEANNRINEILSNTNPAFMTFDNVPEDHMYFFSTFQAQNPGRFLSCLRKEMALLMFSLPSGIIVRGYESRVDILRVMITGPVDTPYEHGLFVFDVHLPPDYPSSPPVFFYLSQCSGRLNPNLYDDGKVCVSLLGTWSGRGSEVWTSKSNVLQVLVSIQGLILCSEPYYNEAGYEKQRGTAEGHENSRLYNEMVLLKLVQSMEKLLKKPPTGLEKEILQHFAQHGSRMIRKFKRWIELSNEQATTVPSCDNGNPVGNDASVSELQPMEESSRNDLPCSGNVNVIDNDVLQGLQAMPAPGCHGGGEQTPKEEISQNELAYSNGVSESGAVKEANSPETRGASYLQPSLQGKSLNAENQGACAGATLPEKIAPDYPLFPISRGFCLSLGRALENFQIALEKAGLADCSEKP